MKKILSIISIVITVFLSVTLTAKSQTLWHFFTDKGQELPPLSERAIMYYRDIGLDRYVGSFQQNQKV